MQWLGKEGSKAVRPKVQGPGSEPTKCTPSTFSQSEQVSGQSRFSGCGNKNPSLNEGSSEASCKAPGYPEGNDWGSFPKKATTGI